MLIRIRNGLDTQVWTGLLAVAAAVACLSTPEVGGGLLFYYRDQEITIHHFIVVIPNTFDMHVTIVYISISKHIKGTQSVHVMTKILNKQIISLEENSRMRYSKNHKKLIQDIF